MTELNTENNGARLSSNRLFLRRRIFILPGLKAQLIFWLLMIAGLALDLWTKRAVFDWLENSGSVSIIDGFLRFVKASNDGAAFGLFSGHPYLLIMVSVVALIVIFAFFLFGGTEKRLIHVAFGLFTAGVCGNLYDRIFNDGRVRDFIDVYYRQYHWPAFNIADTMLCIGIGVLILSTFFTDKPYQTRARQHK
jgi:signal peptidase II